MAYTKYGTSPQVLMPGASFTHNVSITDPNAKPDESGTKWVHAGALLASDSGQDFLNVQDPSSSVLLQPTTDPTKAQAVLMHDVVLDNTTNVGSDAGIVGGEITTKYMDSSVKSVYTPDNIKALKASLPNVIVISR